MSKSFLLAFAESFAVCYVMSKYAYSICWTTQSSMHPTLPASGSVVVVQKFGRPKRGEIVQVRNPFFSTSPPLTRHPFNTRSRHVVKRVGGVVGDIVPVTETQRGGWRGVWGRGGAATRGVEVPPGHLYLVGDNEDRSIDSRHYGPIPENLVEGQVCFVLWPPEKFGSVK